MADALQCRVVSAPAQIERIVPLWQHLRRTHAQDRDMLTDPAWFLSRTRLWGNRPEIVLAEQAGEPVGAVLLYRRQARLVPLRLIKGGNRAGDGLVIAAPGRRAEIVQAAVRHVLTNPWVQMAFISMRGDGPAATRARLTRAVSTHLPLAGGYEAALMRFGRRTRRNLRYYRRQAEEAGVEFVAQLTPEQSLEAVQHLHISSAYPVQTGSAMRLEAAIRGTPGALAMGLRRRGVWLSYVSGWRQAEGTYIEWQLNDAEAGTLSLSTVMRAYLLEHEAHTAPQLVFVGGSSAGLGRYCTPAYCTDLLIARPGLTGMLAQHAMARLRPHSAVGQLIRAPSLP